jgi:hypothetical protein
LSQLHPGLPARRQLFEPACPGGEEFIITVDVCLDAEREGIEDILLGLAHADTKEQCDRHEDGRAGVLQEAALGLLHCDVVL